MYLSVVKITRTVNLPGACAVPSLPLASKASFSRNTWVLDFLLPASLGAENPFWRTLAGSHNKHTLHVEYPSIYNAYDHSKHCLFMKGNITLDPLDGYFTLSYMIYESFLVLANGCFKNHIYKENVLVWHIDGSLIIWMCTDRPNKTHEEVMAVYSIMNHNRSPIDLLDKLNFSKVSLGSFFRFKKNAFDKNEFCIEIECPLKSVFIKNLYMFIGISILCVILFNLNYSRERRESSVIIPLHM